MCVEAESRYHSYNPEELAVVESLDRFRKYLLGKLFKVVTDCAEMSTIKAKTQIIPRIARWWMNLMEYDLSAHIELEFEWLTSMPLVEHQWRKMFLKFQSIPQISF